MEDLKSTATETEVLNYSKKQINPLLEKYKIKPESNSKFKEIIKMFPDQTNYQIWALKLVFNRYADLTSVKYVKEWADANHQLIQKLSLKNIVSYSTNATFNKLMCEIEALNQYAIVKRNVDKFNTDQRKLLSEYFSLNDKTTGEDYANSSIIKDACNKFKEFEKFSDFKQTNFITKCSAFRDVNKIMDMLDKALKNDWSWCKEDLLDFVKTNTTSDVVYDDHNIVILNVKDYESSNKTCGGNKTSWCITSSSSQFENYVLSKNRKQYFMFNFNRDEKDDLSKIGFTVDSKEGITHAHSMVNTDLRPGCNYKDAKTGKRGDIHEILKMFNVPLSVVMGVQLNSIKFKWDKKSFVEFIQKLGKKAEIAYEKGNIIIVRIKEAEPFNELCGYTFVSSKMFNFGAEDSKAYLIFNFDESPEKDNSILSCACRMDEYGTESISQVYNIYGVMCDKQDVFGNIGIKDSEFLTDISLEPQILIQKYIDEGDSENAIKLIHENPDMDINFEFNGRTPIYGAISNAMIDVFNEIINHPKFNKGDNKSPIQDASQIQVLLGYIYSIDNKEKSKYEEMMRIVLDCGKFDLNARSMTNDTLLSTSVLNEETYWVTERLLKDMSIDINTINDLDETVLSLAMYYDNKNAIDLITKRPDIVITESDKQLAKEKGYDLEKLVKPNASLFDSNKGKFSESEDEEVDVKLSEKDKEILQRIKKLIL